MKLNQNHNGTLVSRINFYYEEFRRTSAYLLYLSASVLEDMGVSFSMRLEVDYQGKTNLIVCNMLDHFGSCFIIIICFNPPNFSVRQGYSQFCLKRMK